MDGGNRQVPFLLNSKDKMKTAIIQSNRIPELHIILEYYSTREIQEIYQEVFFKDERDYLEKNWAKNSVAKLLRTKTAQERLPVNWFREND